MHILVDNCAAESMSPSVHVENSKAIPRGKMKAMKPEVPRDVTKRRFGADAVIAGVTNAIPELQCVANADEWGTVFANQRFGTGQAVVRDYGQRLLFLFLEDFG